jgi:hypothetical protein
LIGSSGQALEGNLVDALGDIPDEIPPDPAPENGY